MKAAQQRPSPVPTPTKEEVGPVPLVAAIVRPAAADPIGVTTYQPTGPIPAEPASAEPSILAVRRGRASPPLPLLTRQPPLLVRLVGRDGQLLPSAWPLTPAQRKRAVQAPILLPRGARVVPWQVLTLSATALKPLAIAGAPRPTAQMGIRPPLASPVPRVATVPRIIPAVGPASPPATAPRRPAAIMATSVPARGLTAMGRKGAIALVPTVILVRLARVMALGLVRKPLEEVPTPVGRKP